MLVSRESTDELPGSPVPICSNIYHLFSVCVSCIDVSTDAAPWRSHCSVQHKLARPLDMQLCAHIWSTNDSPCCLHWWIKPIAGIVRPINAYAPRLTHTHPTTPHPPFPTEESVSFLKAMCPIWEAPEGEGLYGDTQGIRFHGTVFFVHSKGYAPLSDLQSYLVYCCQSAGWKDILFIIIVGVVP